MRTVKTKCPHCGTRKDHSVSEVNRARKHRKPLFCGIKCSGLARRKGKTKAQKIKEKRLYDITYRENNRQMLKAKKHFWYKENRDPVKEAKIRKEKMHLHIEYCRRPEYRKWKKTYDAKYRAENMYGPFAEAYLTLLDIDREVGSRMSNYELSQAKGNLNKHQQRRRSYEQITGIREKAALRSKSQERSMGHA